ncbi:MAG TPA: hypothetical protein VGG79_18445 [Roseiarcus sp.]|jgi:hypothetical protein
MRMAATIAVMIACSAATAAHAGQSAQCLDRDALNDVSVDARLVAIKYYFVGLASTLTDPKRHACYEAQAINDPALRVVNKTLELIEGSCAPISSAAQAAIAPACP